MNKRVTKKELSERKYLHLSSTLILFGDLRGTDRCIDISTERRENSMRAKSCDIWTHSGSLQPLIIAIERWRKYTVAFTLRQHPPSAERHTLFSRDLYFFHSFVILLSYLPPYTFLTLYLIPSTFNFSFPFYFLSCFFTLLFSSLFLPFVFTVSLLIISFGLLRHNRFLNIATHVLPLISYVKYYKTKLYHNALICKIFYEW